LGEIVANVRKRGNESLDDLLRRFKRECIKEGLYSELKKRRYFVPPSVRRKQKEAKRR